MKTTEKIFSFDVFDTSIVRSCGSYDNFLEILSFRVFKRNVPDIIRKKFIYARKLAESNVFQNKKSNIYDIYRNIQFEHPYLSAPEELPEIEISLENDVDLPVYTIKERIYELHKEGYRIFYISDMYLGEKILRPLLTKLGLLGDSDKIFVSCDIGHSKNDKTLFEYIKNTEKITYKHWIHTGDNIISDYIIPKSLGIKTQLITSRFSRLQQLWITNDYIKPTKNSYPYNFILASLSNNILRTEKICSRNNFIIDIIAPLYCSFLFNIYETARKNGVNKLFFFARDTFHMYSVATIINKIYPEIFIKYLPISRSTIYNDDKTILLDYLIQEGLADIKNKCAIIDTSSSGQTITTINNLLKSNNYNTVSVYNLLLHINPQYYTSISEKDYCAYISSSWGIYDKIECAIIEDIFSTNTDKRVLRLKRSNNKVDIDYDNNPQEGDVIQINTSEIQKKQTDLLIKYTNNFIKCQLGRYATNILNHIAIPTFFSFLQKPYKEYTDFLLDCKVVQKNKRIPFIEKQKIIHILRHRGKDTFWDRATIFYNLPTFMLRLFISTKL